MNDDFDPLRWLLVGVAQAGVILAVLLLVFIAPWYWSVGIATAIAWVLHAGNITARLPR